MPLGKYKNFKACEKAVAKKGIKNTGAYCGAIEAYIKGTKKKEGKKMNSEYFKSMGKLIRETDSHSRGFYREKDALKMHAYLKKEGMNPHIYTVETKKGIYKYYVNF